MFLNFQGVLIDKENQKLKRYSLIFFRIGKWIDISDYHDFIIKKVDSSETGGIRSAFITVHSKYIDLYLQNKTNDKILIKSCRDHEEAEYIKQLISVSTV